MDGGGPGAPAAHADPIEKRYDGGHGPFSWQEFVHFYGEATAAERWNLGASNVEADGSAPEGHVRRTECVTGRHPPTQPMRTDNQSERLSLSR